MKNTDPYRLHASLGYHLSIAARVQERRLDERLKTIGLTRITWCILLAIGNENHTQPSDIADFVGIDRTATSRALRQLETDGLLGRTCGATDKRTRTVALTAMGKRAIGLATPMARENAHAMSAQLTPTEEDQLKALLLKLRRGETALNTL